MDQLAGKVAIAVVYVTFAVLEICLGRFRQQETSTKRDVILDGASTLVFPVLVIPGVLLVGAPALAQWVHPGGAGWLSAQPGWVMFGLLLVFDDMTQYWWHRLSHSSWLYPLHRAHHSAGYMSVRITYRNNLIYYLMMPGLWFSGALIYWGGADVYFIYAALKMSVIFGAHSSVPWDEPLYRHPWTSKLMWLVERVLSTPATHAAHHGLHESDGVTHYRGNYGNFLFVWDVLFGTARISRRRPAAYGIEGLVPVTLLNEFLKPVAAERLDAGDSRGSALDDGP